MFEKIYYFQIFNFVIPVSSYKSQDAFNVECLGLTLRYKSNDNY